MKRFFLFISLFIKSGYCFSQIPHIELLIGKDVRYVTKYFDSLNSLKSNSTYKIQNDVSANGDLTLTIEFSLYDEEFYNCIGVSAVFQRSSTGEEMCTNEFIWGSTKYANGNLVFVKDNFKFISNNTWEKVPFADMPKLKVKAKFDRIENQYPSFMISYWMKRDD